MKLNPGSPVHSNPAGASPGAEGVTSTSKPAIAEGNACCVLAKTSYAPASSGSVWARPNSIRSRKPSLRPSGWVASSHPSARGASECLTMGWAVLRAAKGSGNSRTSTAAPACANATSTRSNNACVSGAARSHVGDLQIPIRGARPGCWSGSPRSRPATAPAKKAQSATERAITPTVSKLSDMSFMPTRLINPKVGLYPTTPQNAAGRMMLPAVWVPNANGNIPSATPAAEPEDDPPGVCAGLAGLAVGPGLRVANSVVTVLPITTPPTARVQADGAESARGRQPSQIGEP